MLSGLLSWAAAAAMAIAAIALWRKPIIADHPPGQARPAERASLRELHQQNRGRLAETPAQIAPPGWKDVLWRIKDSLGKDRIVAVAAGIAFYSILAIFPAIAALVSLYGFFADPNTVNNHLDNISGLVPGGGMEVIRDQVEYVADQGRSQLGFTFLVGFAASLWSANAGTKAMFSALNVVYHEEEKRGFFRLTATALLFTMGGVVFALLALCVMIVVPIALDQLGFSGGGERTFAIMRWPILYAAIAAALAVIYRYGPSRERPQWRWVSWGSAIAALLWLVVSILFTWYAAHFGSYNKTYGSLGAVVGFMTWIWLSALVVLLGAELDAEMEHQTARDTTTGRPRPLGRRGAQVADTIGPAKE